jgi:Protein of unknwon function (DUF3310)
MSDDVERPAHYMGLYETLGIEVIDVIEAADLGWALSNVLKYVLRHKYKGSPLKDLKKAQFYLTRHIEALQLEERNAEVQRLLTLQPEEKLSIEEKKSKVEQATKKIRDDVDRYKYTDWWTSCDAVLPLQGRVAGQVETPIYNTFYEYDPYRISGYCANCDKELRVGTPYITRQAGFDESVKFCGLTCVEALRSWQLGRER